MEQLSRVQLYQNLIQKDMQSNIRTAFEVNIIILSDVEELFLTLDQTMELIMSDYTELISQIRRNVERIQISDRYGTDSLLTQKLISNILKIVSRYENKDVDITTNARNIFNKLIRELAEYNNKMIDEIARFTEQKQRNNMSQVFLSHAYDDKAYSLALFDYFYERGIYLYVGWMHNELIEDGCQLKEILQKRLDESNQLLFLRTINSELDIRGRHMLRPWCAWELGNFYHKNHGDEKYLINLYSVDCYRNIQVHGLKLFTDVVGGLLSGVEIRP